MTCDKEINGIKISIKNIFFILKIFIYKITLIFIHIISYIKFYEFRKCINNDFLNRILKNIQGESAPQITRPLQKNGKEDLRCLQKWICQILDKEYEYGFKELYQMSRESNMTRKEALKFPALSICDLVV
ncbi:MAG: hypothetical protein CMP69_05540, partial [Flavobacteriales bacterium]|nr:hypothetical protein [Flavobacteriales bacterium]